MGFVLENTEHEDLSCETLTSPSNSEASGPPRSDSFSKVIEKIRWCRKVPADGDIECLAYLSGQKVNAADETDANDPARDDAKVQELSSIVVERNIWEPAPLPPGQRAVTAKWVVLHPQPKHKARFTVRGFQQRQGLDYNETFSPVAKLITLRIFLIIIIVFNMLNRQLDLKTAFLNASLEEEIYMHPTPDLMDLYEKEIKEAHNPNEVAILANQLYGLKSGLLLLLLRALYGLKQAPRSWWKELRKFLISLGFIPSAADEFLTFKRINDLTFVILHFVLCR